MRGIRGVIAVILVLLVVSISGCIMGTYSAPHKEGDFATTRARIMYGCDDVEREEFDEENDVIGETHYWSNDKTGKEYEAIVYPFMDSEIMICEKGYDHYESEDCNEFKYEYGDYDLMAGVEGNDVYFFWVADVLSLRIVEKEGYEGGPEREAVEESFAMTKGLIDYYLGQYTPIKKCE